MSEADSPTLTAKDVMNLGETQGGFHQPGLVSAQEQGGFVPPLSVMTAFPCIVHSRKVSDSSNPHAHTHAHAHARSAFPGGSVSSRTQAGGGCMLGPAPAHLQGDRRGREKTKPGIPN